MSNIESSFPQNTNNKEYGFKGTQFWIEEIKKSGVFESLSYFNDVITEKNAPHEMSGYNLVLQDVLLDGKKCDIYHTDQDQNGNKIGDNTFARVFIHIKE